METKISKFWKSIYTFIGN